MFQDKIVHKIPGEIIQNKKESQGYLGKLEEKEDFELLELLERQEKLIANKLALAKLPDKGERIVKFRDTLLKEIERKDEIKKIANLMSRLNIATEGKAAMSALEWTGRYEENLMGNKIVELDSDDEEDPLRILAQPTGSGVHAKKITVLSPAETLIKPEDLEQIDSFDTEEKEPEHVKYIVNKVENHVNKSQRAPFKPYKTTKTNVHDPMKEKLRRKSEHWEITAATPPLIVHGAVKMLSIHESIKLQKEQAENLSEIRTKHSIERLTQRIGLSNIGDVNRPMEDHRVQDSDSDSSSSKDEEEIEVHDDEDNDKAGTVVFKVDSIDI